MTPAGGLDYQLLCGLIPGLRVAAMTSSSACRRLGGYLYVNDAGNKVIDIFSPRPSSRGQPMGR